jgi:hypothetical protein
MAAGCRRPSGYSKAVRAQRWLRDLSRGGIRRTFDATDLASIVEVFGRHLDVQEEAERQRCVDQGLRILVVTPPAPGRPRLSASAPTEVAATEVTIHRSDEVTTVTPPARPTTLRSSKRSRISRVVIVRRWSRRPTPPGRQLSTTQVLRPPPCRTARAELPQIRSGRPRFSRRWPPRPR